MTSITLPQGEVIWLPKATKEWAHDTIHTLKKFIYLNDKTRVTIYRCHGVKYYVFDFNVQYEGIRNVMECKISNAAIITSDYSECQDIENCTELTTLEQALNI